MEHSGRKDELSPFLPSVKEWRDSPASLELPAIPFYEPPERSEWEASWGPLEEAVCWRRGGAVTLRVWQPLSSNQA